MMKRNFLFRLLFCFFSIIDDDGGGGDGDAPQATDNQNTDPSTAPQQQDAANTPPPAVNDNDTVKINKSDFEYIKSIVEEKRNADSIAAADSAIKTHLPDFDLQKVGNHLKELAKTEPEKAAALNNPTGWMIVHNQLKSGNPAPVADAVNHGRNSNNSSNLSDLVLKIGNGNGGIAAKAAFYEQFL